MLSKGECENVSLTYSIWAHRVAEYILDFTHIFTFHQTASNFVFVCACVKDVKLIFLPVHGVIIYVARKVIFRIKYFVGFSFESPIFKDKCVQSSEYKSALDSGLLVPLIWIDGKLYPVL